MTSRVPLICVSFKEFLLKLDFESKFYNIAFCFKNLFISVWNKFMFDEIGSIGGSVRYPSQQKHESNKLQQKQKQENNKPLEN